MVLLSRLACYLGVSWANLHLEGRYFGSQTKCFFSANWQTLLRPTQTSFVRLAYQGLPLLIFLYSAAHNSDELPASPTSPASLVSLVVIQFRRLPYCSFLQAWQGSSIPRSTEGAISAVSKWKKVCSLAYFDINRVKTASTSLQIRLWSSSRSSIHCRLP